MNLIQHNVPLNDKNWFKTGGAARFFIEPANAQDFQYACAFAQQNNLPIFVLGEGANVLISDDGFDGLVIRPFLKQITHEIIDDKIAFVHAGAGVTINDLIEYCLQHNLSALEEFSGIPGTVGGSVYINLHYFEFLLDQFLVRAEVIERETGIIKTVSPEWFNFAYDFSTLHDEKHYLVHATFKTKRISELETAYARGRRTEIMRHRFKRYPIANTCGSFFRNFLPHEIEPEKTGVKLPYIAYYLDKIGVKGKLSVGDAIVSHQHANMIINRGNATSTDIINLAQKMQELVHKEFNLTPHAECRLIGFKDTLI
ncbi:MAG TPA: UDP-N-acetylmuramate dehydrogenase [Candidatus Babeliales bacterium]|nr:UDP-N-acetylmuramate dehydrogenase [Candidatus Babeliales bacterium]